MRTINGWLLAAFAIGSLLPATPADSQQWPYSFVEEPFIHPRIINDFSTWLSDTGDQIVAINLLDAQGSNRYFGDVEIRAIDGECPWVSWERGGRNGSFGYQYIGMTESNVHLLFTSNWGGGSGQFRDVMLLTIEPDTGIDWEGKERERLLLRKIGEIGLGDRWAGELRVTRNTLWIGPDEGWFSVSGGSGSGDRPERTLRIDAQRPDALDFGASEYACAAAATGE